jgi:hypothetical protein
MDRNETYKSGYEKFLALKKESDAYAEHPIEAKERREARIKDRAEAILTGFFCRLYFGVMV